MTLTNALTQRCPTNPHQLAARALALTKRLHVTVATHRPAKTTRPVTRTAQPITCVCVSVFVNKCAGVFSNLWAFLVLQAGGSAPLKCATLDRSDGPAARLADTLAPLFGEGME